MESENKLVNTENKQLTQDQSSNVSASQNEFLERLIALNDIDADKIEKLGKIYMEMEDRNAKKQFEEAMQGFKRECKPIVKNKQVRFMSSKGLTSYNHAELEQVCKTIDPILPRHGLSYRWNPGNDNGQITVTVIVSHIAGHSEKSTVRAPIDTSGGKNSVQGIGSSITYLQRYTILTALGLVAEDDNDARLDELVEKKKVLGQDWFANRRRVNADQKFDRNVLIKIITKILNKPTIDFINEFKMVNDALFVQQMFDFSTGDLAPELEPKKPVQESNLKKPNEAQKTEVKNG